jgi:hypothetical protein
VRDQRLDELLRDARAHGDAPRPDDLRALQESVLARFAAERAGRSAPSSRGEPTLAWLERGAMAVASLTILLACADWFGSLWAKADSALPSAPESGWLTAAADLFLAQPWLGVMVLLGFSLLCIPTVRQDLLGELR